MPGTSIGPLWAGVGKRRAAGTRRIVLLASPRYDLEVERDRLGSRLKAEVEIFSAAS